MHVTVLTCDKYYDMTLPHFRRFFAKHWPGQDFAVVSDKSRAGVDFAYPAAATWSQVLIAYASDMVHFQEATVLLLDDYLLADNVHVEAVTRYWKWIVEHHEVGFIRLNPCPGPDLEYKNLPELGMFAPNQEYLTSLQPCIWRLSALLGLLEPEESPWEFEIQGTKRARQAALDWVFLDWVFLGTRENTVSVNNLVRNGVQVPEVLEWIEAQS